VNQSRKELVSCNGKTIATRDIDIEIMVSVFGTTDVDGWSSVCVVVAGTWTQ
jgi:hypothetical protein